MHRPTTTARANIFHRPIWWAAALGSCMLTLMALAARRLEIELKGTRVEIQKVMAANPRRIAEIKFDFYFPGSYIRTGAGG